MNKLHLRASSADLFLKCSKSLTKRPKIPIHETSEAAERGTRVHKMIERFIIDGEIPQIEDQEDRMLFYTAKNLWENKLLPYFPTPNVEIAMEAPVFDASGEEIIHLTGHADVVQLGRDFVAVLDWKTGRVERSHYGQMLAYGLLAADYYGKERAIVSVAHLRSGKLKTHEYDRAALNKYQSRLIEQAIFGYEYSVGEHCGFCPNRFECPARVEIVKSSVSDISNVEYDIRGLVENGRLDSVFAASQILERSIKKFRAAIKEYVANAGGSVKTDKFEYLLQETQRSSINAKAATQILKERFTVDEILNMLKIDKGALEKAAMNKVKRGQKTAAKLNILRDLEAAGAIETKTYQKLTQKERENE